MQNTLSLERLSELRGADVYDEAGDKIGGVEEIFYDEETRQPEWIGIGTGFFKMKRVLVPIQGATVTDDGITVPYSKDRVKDAPDTSGDRISEAAEADLYAYYGLQGSTRRSDSMLPEGSARPPADTGYERDVDVDPDRSMTRSEEEIAVGKREQEVGRARLRKWVETEPVEATVELREERVRVERQPIDEPVRGAEISEDVVETTVRGEEAVVEKRAVAKERVSLEKDVDTRQETVRDEVRKERVEIEGDVVDRERGSD